MTQPDPDTIYKVTTVALWARGQESGVLPPSLVDEADGFMHFSTGGQVRETLRLHFKDQRDLMLLAVDCAALGSALRWEPSRGGQMFPHLYAELPMTAVTSARAVPVDAEGHSTLPETFE